MGRAVTWNGRRKDHASKRVDEERDASDEISTFEYQRGARMTLAHSFEYTSQ